MRCATAAQGLQLLTIYSRYLKGGLTSQRSIPIPGVDGLLTRHGQSPETDSGQWLYRSIISMGIPVGLVTWIERTIPNGGTLPSKTAAASPE